MEEEGEEEEAASTPVSQVLCLVLHAREDQVHNQGCAGAAQPAIRANDTQFST